MTGIYPLTWAGASAERLPLGDQAHGATQADRVLTRHRLNDSNPPFSSGLPLAEPADRAAALR